MKYDTIIVGGGFYGLSIALFLRDELGVSDILVIEKESTTMTRASYTNQARVHNGYHYPRSILTGYRSAINFPRFVKDYDKAIVSDFDKYYGVARILSKINAKQFRKFSEKIGVDISDAGDNINNYFNPRLVEKIFKVKEYAFDSYKLRDQLLKDINAKPGIILKTGEAVELVKSYANNIIEVKTDKETYQATHVLNCTYSQINNIHRNSGLSLVSLKHEIVEMCLVTLPIGMEGFSITMMDGPFFSIMPFPTRGLYSLSHVRYTPHESWEDNAGTPTHKQDTHRYFADMKLKSNYKKIYSDVIRYIPALKDMKYVDSISEVKTILLKSENDDSRPILFKPHFGIHNYTCIMGGKLDNIYDVFDELKDLYEKT
jgi:glycine/D-amino acid oxidase-like deaminating enzyme